MTEHMGVEVKITQYLENIIIQHVMLSYTVIAEEIAPHLLLLIKNIFVMDINIFVKRLT